MIEIKKPICAECKVELTPLDLGNCVSTDAGLVHRECFQGPVPAGGLSAEEIVLDHYDEIIDIEAEEAARREHNDVPLTPGWPDDPRIPLTFGTADDDGGDRRVESMAREQRSHGGLYDSDGITY